MSDLNGSAHSTFGINVIGQTRSKRVLLGALQRGTLASSYLFFGPPGVGKLALALELARGVNCRSEDGKPCHQCSSCRRIQELKHPDVSVIFPRPKKITDQDLHESITKLAANPYVNLSFSENAEIHIDAVRAVRSEAGLRPYESHKKVFIIAEADRMNTSAANALLKTLEEPPPHVLMILTSARPGRLPATVLSRCQQIRFTPLSPAEVAEGLERLALGTAPQRRLACHLAQGNMQLAMELLQENIHGRRSKVLQILSTTLEGDLLLTMTASQTLAKTRHRSENQQLLESFRVWYRDLLILLEGREDHLVNADMKPQLASMAAQYDWQGVEKALDAIDESHRAMEVHVNPELLWTVLLSRLKRLRRT